ncbi:hypothetical protein [Amycolatopsis sp. 195334CR]|uniref:hypothetical protein n=1 Tax=Amycolatopsis sp. 195334CR TaxID=2814588 RepID=UPI001A8C26C9|nr:hypothetical protein [Amycolatopsis sp. 195334CR]MBN6042024.1 hypothetical protein [Amycolatopsis sp. 195334CR]
MLLLAVDAWRYGPRDDRAQFDLQEALAEAMDVAAATAGLDQSEWRTQEAGDGFLAVVADSSAEPTIIDQFVRLVDEWLAKYNKPRLADARLRLKIAVHHGVAVEARLGFAGQGVVHVCRLCDSAPARKALERIPEANLVLVVSELVAETVHQWHTSLVGSEFLRISIDSEQKGFHAVAWLRVPGVPPEKIASLLGGEGDTQESMTVAAKMDGGTPVGQVMFDDILVRTLETAELPISGKRRTTSGEVLFELTSRTSWTRLLGPGVRALDGVLRARFPGSLISLGVTIDDEAVARELAGSCRIEETAVGARRSGLVIMVSDQVYNAVVRDGGLSVQADAYRRAEGDFTAWVRVTGESMPPPPPSPERSGRGPLFISEIGKVNGTVSQIGEVRAGSIQFGDNYGRKGRDR